MKKTKEVICEEQKFLRLCSETYKDMIHKKRNGSSGVMVG